jgi:HAE1 family hydrophobic/amphiphilic exporter-1
MNIPLLSVKRPVFITSIVLLLFFSGWQAFLSLPVNLFPEADLPIVSISTLYPGAGPREIESSISKPLEDELATLEGTKKITTISQDSLSLVIVEFHHGVNLDTVEQKLRDKVERAKTKFPRDAEDPILERLNPSNQPILTVFVDSMKMNRVELSEWADQELKPLLSRIPKVGRVELVGATKREIRIEADPRKLENYRIPLLSIAQSLESSGQNVPGGSLTSGVSEIGVRAIAQFEKLSDIESRVISFANGERGVRIGDLGTVIDGAEKERSRAYVNGKTGLIVQIYKQSGANTIAVTNSIKKEIGKITEELSKTGGPELKIVRDGSKLIRDSVFDVWESIIIGVILTVIVVYFFLGSLRSTLITGFAIPNSLIGAFVLMSAFGFSLNILTLLALSLCVGLLVDDAIVVRENIFKHLERGKPPKEAAVDGANEVAMAVVAVTIAVLAMFGPVGFLKGTIGQFFREFGLTVCFAMMISLFDAMAVAPMLSAYWAGAPTHPGASSKNPFHYLVRAFDRFQSWLEKVYKHLLTVTLKVPVLTMTGIMILAAALCYTASLLPSAFLPIDQSNEFSVTIKVPAGSNLETTAMVAKKVESVLLNTGYIENAVTSVGNAQQEINVANAFAIIKPVKFRKGKRPSEIREEIRQELREIKDLPKDTEITVGILDLSGAGVRPFSLLIQTSSQDSLGPVAKRVAEKLKEFSSLKDVVLELRPGAQELMVELRSSEAQRLGVSPGTTGSEIRARIEGLEVAKLREEGREYDIKLTTRDPAELWLSRKVPILVPNVGLIPVDLRSVADFKFSPSPAKIEKVNRAYTARITAELTSEGLTAALEKLEVVMKEEMDKDASLRFMLEGDAESFDEMSTSMGRALLFSIVLLFLVLASLYESFLLSFLNIITLPLAVSGAFLALWMFNDGLHLYSMIGMLLLLGVATKNSILLIDTAKELFEKHHGVGVSIAHEITEASVLRLRPILMTSLALIAGTIPIAIGLNEASAQRTGMGIAIIGGTVTSTVFTLVFIPSLLILVQKYRTRKQRIRV